MHNCYKILFEIETSLKFQIVKYSVPGTNQTNLKLCSLLSIPNDSDKYEITNDSTKSSVNIIHLTDYLFTLYLLLSYVIAVSKQSPLLFASSRVFFSLASVFLIDKWLLRTQMEYRHSSLIYASEIAK